MQHIVGKAVAAGVTIMTTMEVEAADECGMAAAMSADKHSMTAAMAADKHSMAAAMAADE